MDARGPADPPATQDRPGSAAEPLRGKPGPVLSLEERKAERQRRASEAAAAPAASGGSSRSASTPLRAVADREEAPAAPPPAPAAARPQGRPAALGPASASGSKSDPPGPAPAPPAAKRPFPQPARRARSRGRHILVMLSFLLLVAAPIGVAAWYLWERAAPRYASQVGFSVRTEDSGSALDLLGGMASLAGGSSSKDTDILYRFIQSQEIVAKVDERLDLRALWAKGDPEQDPIFAYHPPGTIEDLHEYWARMVAVYNDTGTGLLDVEVQAFTPDDARAIAQAIYEESQALINRLSAIAQEDKTRHALEERDEAVRRLTEARVALTRFRNETQIVDPVTALQGQMGLLNSLEAQLAQTLIDLDLLRLSTGEGDPRIEQALSRVAVIESRMEEERAKLGFGRGPGAGDGEESTGDAFADLVGQYETLAVDQEFAQQAYVAAMAAYDSALAEGRQQSRYLAAHVEPTLAQRADYPQRWTLTLLTALFAGLGWMLLTLAAYALRDRR